MDALWAPRASPQGLLGEASGALALARQHGALAQNASAGTRFPLLTDREPAWLHDR
jgi:hypothetical protein